jgi:ParB/RepB/Spo0J family partition protein
MKRKNQMKTEAASPLTEAEENAIADQAATIGGLAQLAGVNTLRDFLPAPGDQVYDVTELGIDLLIESPNNPRRRFGDLTEITESIRKVGLLQPLLVRKMLEVGGDRVVYEVIFGHRRLRAAKAAGLTHVPVKVRQMNDLEVLEAQLVENGQREDVHPLEEAEAFERLIKFHGRTAEEIAARIGKSRSHVFARLKLLELAPESREAFYSGRINASIAYLIARIPDPKIQGKAIDRVAPAPIHGDDRPVEPLSFRAASQVIQQFFTLDLRHAPFNVKDDMLVASAGACVKCPKRSGCNRELFADIEGPDVCTDPSCYESKVKANTQIQREKFEKRGYEVLEGAEGRKVFQYGHLGWDSKFVELGAPCLEDPERRSYRKLLSDAEEKPKLIAALDGEGKFHEIAAKDQVAAALKAAGHKFAAKLQKTVDVQKPKTAEEKASEERDREVRRRVLSQLREEATNAIERDGLRLPSLRMIALALIQDYRCERTMERRGVKDDRELEKLITSKMEEAGLMGLVFELATESWIGDDYHELGAEAKAVAKAFKVDLKKLEKDADAWLAVAEKVEAEKTKPVDPMKAEIIPEPTVIDPAMKKKQAKKAAAKKKGGK